MGNCLRLLHILCFSEQDEDAAPLDPGQAEDGRATDVTDTDESDESPLFFRMLTRSGRRNRRNRTTENARDTSRAEGSPASSRRNADGSRSSRRQRRNRTHVYREHISATEQHQILTAQRLGLIQHLPLILWESKASRKATTEAPSVQLTTTSNAQQPTSSSISTGMPPTPRSRISTEGSTSTSNVQMQETSSPTSRDQKVCSEDAPPSYEKSAMPGVFEDDVQVSNVVPDTEKTMQGSGSEREDLECTICMEDFEDGQSIRYLPCMHFYHQHCIDSWLMKSFTCPRCMEAVDTGIMNSFAEQLS